MLGLIEAGGVDLIVNTPWGRGPRTDGYLIRRRALMHGVPCITTLAGAAAIQGIELGPRRHQTRELAPGPLRGESMKFYSVNVEERKEPRLLHPAQIPLE